MNYDNQKFITKGVDLNINPLLQSFMWSLIEAMPKPKDYLQVFEFSQKDGKQKITHIQEEPEYKQEYLLKDAPVFIGKIFVIDDETHSTMLLAEEY